MRSQRLETVQVETRDTATALFELVAGRFLECVEPEHSGALALSGGRTASGLFQAIARETLRRGVDWRQWHCFWADERCVPQTDDASNYRVAHRFMLEPLRWSVDRVHRLRGELEPQRAAELGGEALRSVLGDGGRLDHVLLGMGEDGHVASLFPGGAWESYAPSVGYVAVQGPKPPENRVTLTLQTLIQAQHAWVVVCGAAKRAVLERAMTGEESLPLGRLISFRRNTQVFYSE